VGAIDDAKKAGRAVLDPERIRSSRIASNVFTKRASSTRHHAEGLEDTLNQLYGLESAAADLATSRTARAMSDDSVIEASRSSDEVSAAATTSWSSS